MRLGLLGGSFNPASSNQAALDVVATHAERDVEVSVGTTGGERAIEQLVHTLSWQGALVERFGEIS